MRTCVGSGEKWRRACPARMPLWNPTSPPCWDPVVSEFRRGASHTFIALSESGRKLLWNALGALASVQSHASWDDHPAHRRARSGAIRRHAAATLTIEPLLHSDMLIGQRDGRRLRNWQLVLPFATTYRTGSRVSVPRPTASLLMALPWYGKDDGSFIGKIGTGPKPEARNRLRGV